MNKERLSAFREGLESVLEIFEPHVDPDFDHWYELVDSEKYFNEFLAEVSESHEEFQKQNFSELEWELWDVVWDLFSLIAKLEDEWKVDSREVFRKIRDKLERRKPFLVTWERVTKDEAVRLWNEAKKAEWYSDDRLWHEKREGKDVT